MRIKLFTFVKPSDTATMFSHKIARFLSRQLSVPITWSDDVGRGDADVLIMVAGGVPFCRHLSALARAVLSANRVVYCTNDYHTTRLPASHNSGRSPYRAAFRIRAKRGMSAPLLWSTLEGADAHVNWNALAWAPRYCWREENPQTLLYYGSWRPARLGRLDLFLSRPRVKTVISSATDRSKIRWPSCQHVGSIAPGIIQNIGHHGLGLYVSDPKSISEPPACRFYEMLSAGLPMIFHRPAAEMIRRYGSDFCIEEDMIVSGADDVPRSMRMRRWIERRQQTWRANYDEVVVKQLEEAVRCL